MTKQQNDPWTREVERLVRQALTGVRFGTVTLIVQDRRIIQVDRSEKFRMNKPELIDGGGI